MNRILLKRKIYLVAGLAALSLAFYGCSLLRPSIVEENDVVYSTKRFLLSNIIMVSDPRSPSIPLEQSIVKEVKANGEVTYTFYDVLTLSSTSFKLKDEVFLIADSKVFSMTLVDKELEQVKNIEEKKSDILKADSTKVSVVTGYSEENKKVYRFTYRPSDEVLAAIKSSKELLIRYYAGPKMLTATLKGTNLELIKQLIDKK